jgi:hypothetical protein
MKYSSLESSFLSFSREVICYMKSNLPDESIGKYKFKKTVFDETGWHEVEAEAYSYFSGLPLQWQGVLEENHQTKQYIKIQNEQLNIPYKVQLHQLIAPLLDAIHSKLSFHLSDEELLEKYRIHKSNWVNEERYEFQYIPLINFTAELDIEFSDLLAIKSIPNELKTEFHGLYQSSMDEFDLTSMDIWRAKFMIIVKNVWTIGKEKPDGREDLLPLISALRLHKPGDIGTKSRMTKHSSLKPTFFGPSGGPVHEYYTQGRGENYHLSPVDIPLIVKTFNELSSVMSG